MEAVSELLGHSSVAITRSTYVHTTVEDLRRHWTQDNRVADD
jgi:integrase